MTPRPRIFCRLSAVLFAALLSACASFGLDPTLDSESQARLDDRWRSLKMSEADIGALRTAIDLSADPGKAPVRLGADGTATVTLSVPGWQGCRSIDLAASFTNTVGQKSDAHLAGLLCPPQPISELGHWQLARIQILSPAPEPAPPPAPARHTDKGGSLGTLLGKPAPAKR